MGLKVAAKNKDSHDIKGHLSQDDTQQKSTSHNNLEDETGDLPMKGTTYARNCKTEYGNKKNL